VAVTKQQVIFEFDAETGQLTGKLDDTKKSVDRVADSTNVLTNQLDKMTGGAVSGFKNAVSGTKSFIKGLKLTKAAIIGTGIGALVIAVVGLVKAFTRSEEGARKFAKSFEVVKTVTNVILDRLGMLGKAVVQLFERDFSGAAETARAAVSGINKEIKEEVELFDDLIQREHDLQDARIAQRVETAKTRAEIKELNLIAEDTTKTLEEREAAAAKAGEKERELFERRKELAQEELAIAKARLENTASTTEDRENVAELEAEIFTLAQESLELQTTLNNKLNIIRQEGVRQQEEARKAEEEATQKAIDDAEKEAEAAKKAAEKKEAAEKKRLEEEEKAKQKADAADKKRRAEALAAQKALQDQRFALTLGALGALQSLNQAFSKRDEASAKEAFKRNKSLSLATATVNTAQAVVNALTAGGNPIKLATGAQFVEAGIAAATGLAQIASISKTQFQGGGGNVQPPGAPGTGTGFVGQANAPQLDLGFLGEGSGQNTIRAYVVAENVSNAQQANQKVEDQTTL
jgi:chemotaxis protein histidine kinase CheA